MLHFVTSYMTQNQKRQQRRESAQYGLKIVASRLYIFVVGNSPSFSNILSLILRTEILHLDTIKHDYLSDANIRF